MNSSHLKILGIVVVIGGLYYFFVNSIPGITYTFPLARVPTAPTS